MDDLDRLYRRLAHNIRTKYPHYLTTSFSAEEVYQVIVPYRHNRQELGIETNQDYEMALMRLLAGERGYVTADRDVREALTREIETSNPDTSLFRAFNDRMIALSPELLDHADSMMARNADDARIASPMAEPRAPAMPPSARPASSRKSLPPTNRGRGGGLGIPPSPAAAAAIPIAGMPLPPAPSASRDGNAGSPHAPAPEAVTPVAQAAAPIRLSPSNAPTTSNPASGKAIGLTGHGSTVPAAGSMGVRGSLTNSPGTDMASPRRSISAAAVGGRCRYCSGALPDGRQLTFCPHCGQDLTVQQCPACSTELELGWKFCTTCGRGVAQA